MKKILEYFKGIFVKGEGGELYQVNLSDKGNLSLMIDDNIGQLIEDDQNNIFLLDRCNAKCFYAYSLKSKLFKTLPVLEYLKKNYNRPQFSDRSSQHSIGYLYLSGNKKQLIFVFRSSVRATAYLCVASLNDFTVEETTSDNHSGVQILKAKDDNLNKLNNLNEVMKLFYPTKKVYYCGLVECKDDLLSELEKDWFFHILLVRKNKRHNRINDSLNLKVIGYNKKKTKFSKLNLNNFNITTLSEYKLRFKSVFNLTRFGFNLSPKENKALELNFFTLQDKELEVNLRSGSLAYSNREIFLRNHEIKFLNHLKNKFEPGRTIFYCDLVGHKNDLCNELKKWSLCIVYDKCGKCTLIAHPTNNSKLELSFDSELMYLCKERVGFRLNSADINKNNYKSLNEKQRKSLEYLCSKELEVDLESGILTHSEVGEMRKKMYSVINLKDVDILFL